MAERYDIAIIGAGPAGAMAACLCGRQGATVLLVDKARFPRAKVCGGCLGGEALGVLERAGMGGLVTECGAQPLRALRLAVGDRTADVPLVAGRAVSRRRFDHALAKAAAAAGVTFCDATAASLLDATENEHRLTLRHCDDRHRRRDVRARVVLVADGIAGTCLADRPGYAWQVARRGRVGFATVLADGSGGYDPGVIHMAVGRDGYIGVVGVEDGQLDVAAAADAPALREAGGPAAMAERLLAEAGLPAIAGLTKAAWRGTPWLTRRRRTVADDGLMVIGDAAGYVEPFTGEGMGWALRSAEAVAPIALDAVADPDTARQWAKYHHEIFTARYRRCGCIAALLRRPMLMRLTTAMLSRRPALAAPITRRLAMRH